MRYLWCFMFGHKTVNTMLAARGFTAIFPPQHAPCLRCGRVQS